ncbi:MAG TPA: hypothetical protein VH062_13630 [Polyangiaceae bacterium]|jgi:hypothetical protein|nr:hypothetical protein [Polyangiaceae bacterium]
MTHFVRTHVALTLSLLSASFVACSAEAPESGASSPDDATQTSTSAVKVLAKVVLQDGRTVEFLEPDPGIIFTRELGQIGKTPLTGTEETARMTSVELYEHLAGEKAPAALVEASASARTLPAGPVRDHVVNETVEPAPAKAPAIEQTAQALSNGLDTPGFQAAYCPVTYEYGNEFYNWILVSSTGSLTRSDVDNFRSAAMAVVGTIHFVAKVRPWFTWRNLADEDIPAGWYDRVNRNHDDNSYDFDARATVSQADNSTYNMCTHF